MSNQIQKAEPVQMTHSERFAAAVQREYLAKNGRVKLTSFQIKLIQNYFLRIDSILQISELKRMKKSDQYREPTPYVWNNINIKKLALDVVAFSSVGLDPLQPNHIEPIPYKNNATGKYDITFIIGYKGIELKSRKYGLDLPDDIVCELVFSNDKFREYKKNMNNQIEGYDFEVTNSFDRGEIIGGFYYKVYNDAPERNKLRVFSLHDLEKRKPAYASAEFYGGMKKVWKNGKAVEEEVEGWTAEMHLKNIKRAAWNSIIIDSMKIDEALRAMLDADAKAEIQLQEVVELKANQKVINFETPKPLAEPEDEKMEDNEPDVVEEELNNENTTDDPGF